jgi:hypothetical protein
MKTFSQKLDHVILKRHKPASYTALLEEERRLRSEQARKLAAKESMDTPFTIYKTP